MASIKLSEVNINLWNKYNVNFTPNSDVNIIVGINGTGKTTLLTEIEKILPKDSYIYIPSVDNMQSRDKRKKETALSQDLDSYIYDMKTGPSLMYYRMSILDASEEKQIKVKKRLKDFIEVVNSLFKDTKKKIGIVGNKFTIDADGTPLIPDELSSGEKQILLLLLRVFLLDNKETIVMIDEPESSLDISWQYKLIDILVGLNPNAQFFITTHSPSIFGNGWGDMIIYMEDVTNNLK